MFTFMVSESHTASEFTPGFSEFATAGSVPFGRGHLQWVHCLIKLGSRVGHSEGSIVSLSHRHLHWVNRPIRFGSGAGRDSGFADRVSVSSGLHWASSAIGLVTRLAVFARRHGDDAMR